MLVGDGRRTYGQLVEIACEKVGAEPYELVALLHGNRIGSDRMVTAADAERTEKGLEVAVDLLKTQYGG